MKAGFLLGALAGVASAIDTLQVNGTKFFTSSGKQFFIKGVAYQPTDANQTTANGRTGATINDPLADPTGCQNSVALLQKLGANVIRVYRVNATLNHDSCMQTFANAGIYLFLDLETPDTTVISDSPTWTVSQYQAFTQTLDAFIKYPNMAGFFIGNENVDQFNRSEAAPFLKAAARDMRSYIQAKGYRRVPVGYASADVADLQIQLAQYLSCGPTSDGIEFYGLNTYRACGASATESGTGYDILYQQYKNLSRPVFLSEFGCNVVKPRTFPEAKWFLGEYSDVFSGVIAYEWPQEDNDYGLVTYSGSTPTPLADFTALSSAWGNVTPSSTALSNYAGATTASYTCPRQTSGFAAATSLPPTPDAQYCACAVRSAKCSAQSGLSDTTISSAFGIVCGLNSGKACNVISVNGTTGTYGQYSFCSPQQQLALVYQNYYSQQSSSSNACGFTGATLVSSPSTASCARNSGAALANGNAASATGTNGGSGSGGSGTTSSGSSSSGGTRSSADRPRPFFGQSTMVVALSGSLFAAVAAFIVI